MNPFTVGLAFSVHLHTYRVGHLKHISLLAVEHSSLLTDAARAQLMLDTHSIVDTCLHLLGDNEHGDAVPTGSISIGQAHTRLLRLHGDDMALTCAWLCLKVCVRAVEHTPSVGAQEATTLSVHLVTSVSPLDVYAQTIDLLVNVLTRIKGARIKGALDACALAFMTFCDTCSRHDDASVQRLPVDVVLDRVCTTLKNNMCIVNRWCRHCVTMRTQYTLTVATLLPVHCWRAR